MEIYKVMWRLSRQVYQSQYSNMLKAYVTFHNTLGQFWLIWVTSGTIELSITSTTPQSTSQSTPMKPEPTPTVQCNTLHSPSHLVLSTDSSDNPDNPRMNTNWLPSIANWGTWASISTSVFWASTSTQWASGHPPHPWWGQNPPLVSINPDPVSPYSNYFTLFVSFQPCAYYSWTHPWFLHSHIPIPPDSWLWLLVYKDLLLI